MIAHGAHGVGNRPNGGSVMVKNTFLEFAQEDPWLIDPNDVRRQNTDSIAYGRQWRAVQGNHDYDFNAVSQAYAVEDLFEQVEDAGDDSAWCHGGRPGLGNDRHESEPLVPVSTGGGDFDIHGDLVDFFQDDTGTIHHRSEEHEDQGDDVDLRGCTTVMMRHIPTKYTQQKLAREIDSSGFFGKYDFFYLPMDTRSRSNRGFAFCNFESSELAQEFFARYHHSFLRSYASDKQIQVTRADIQGFEANAEHYVNSKAFKRSRDPHNRPMFLRTLPAHLDLQARDDGQPQPIAHEEDRRHASQQQNLQLRQHNSFNGYSAPHQQLQPQRQQPQPGCGSMVYRSSGHLQAPAPVAEPVRNQAADARVQRFCCYCGKRKQPDYVFCPYCGAQSTQDPEDEGTL